MFTLMVEDTFSAAHQLLDYRGPCENLHGHTWKVQLQVEGIELDAAGMLVDFKVLKKVLADELDRFDHYFINDKVDFSPTSENLARHFFRIIKPKLPDNAVLTAVTVWESATASATYRE